MQGSESERLLSEIERQQLELYVNTSEGPTPWWYFPLLGFVAGATIASYDLGIPWVTILVAIVAAAAIGGSVASLQSRAGFSPRLSALPIPLERRTNAFLAAGTILLLGACGFAAFIADSSIRFTLAGVVVVSVISVGGTIFERRYRVHAHQLARDAGLVDE